jgi:hypothetical protein
MMRMKKLLFVLATTAFGLIFALGTAQAQTVTSTGTNQGIVDLTLQGVIQSSLVLDITTTGITTLTSQTSNTMPTRSVASIDFGTFSTQSGTLSNGRIARVAGPTAGAFAIAELEATVTFSGNASGVSTTGSIDLTLGASGGLSPIGLNNTRVQRVPAAWATSAAGTIVGAAVSICPNGTVLGGDCASGVAQGHELAVFVPDTQAAGNFTQVVTYTASAQ